MAELIDGVVRAAIPRNTRTWIKSPARSFQWLWDYFRFSLGITRSLQLAPDWSPACHPAAYRVMRDAQLGDPDQSEEFRNFLTHCSDAMFLFDIGAHFGTFSLAAAHFGGKAVAVDPSPEACKMIATQAALNGLAPGIRIVQAAVSDSVGTLEMLSTGAFSGWFFKAASGAANRGEVRVESLTIDEMTSRFGVPTHIKIDVEGHEAAVLRGARDTLKRYDPLLFLELHNDVIRSNGGDPGSILDELSDLGYPVLGLDGHRIGKSELIRHSILHVMAGHSALPSRVHL
jgi:FkbM family methyltransferase